MGALVYGSFQRWHGTAQRWTVGTPETAGAQWVVQNDAGNFVFSGTGHTHAWAIVPASAAGSVTAYHTQKADLLLDVNGYFAP